MIAPHLEPPILSLVSPEPTPPITADLDDGWGFDDEPAATDGGLLGKPDVELAEFPEGPSDAEVAAMVDELSAALCRPASSRARR
jgi:hypothetical protein